MHGGIFVNNTSAQSGGPWMEIYAVSATVVASSTSNISGLNNFSLAAGQSVSGNFTAFTLTSGSVIAYNARHQG